MSYWDCSKIKSPLDEIATLVEKVFGDEKSCREERICREVYLWFREVDHYCNNDYPEGSRHVKNKGEIIRKFLGRTYPCLDASGFDPKLCDSCKRRFLCYTDDKRNKIIAAINKAVEEDAMLGRELYEGTFPETVFEARKRELSDCLGLEVK